LEHGLQPWVAFLIVPVFALANAGVTVGAAAADFLLQPVSLGIVLGLLVGKQAGILAFAWLAVRAGVAELPSGVSWRYLHGVAALCGVGFTMALFIGNLAFADPALLEQAKIAVLAASVLAAGLARVLFDVAAHHQARGEEPSRRLVARTTEADGVRPHEEAA
jgi:NhaA family Na+:H+ antiporter